MKIPQKLLIICLVFSLSLVAQGTGELVLTTDYFYNYEIIYLLDLDLDNGANNPDIFQYSLEYTAPDGNGTPGSGTPIEIIIDFEMIANVPFLDWDSEQIFHIKTYPFEFNGSVTISTKDLDQNMDNLYYNDGRQVTGIEVEIADFLMSASQAEKLFYDLVNQQGQLPEGEYVFDFTVTPVNSPLSSINQHQVIEVSNPTSVDLVNPGGPLSDNMEIYTLYPLFQWETNDYMWNTLNCPECGTYIRICEYDQLIHSSIEEALNDRSSVPYPDTGGGEEVTPVPLGMGTNLYTAEKTFQYPFTEAKPLEEGHTYVWQVKKIYPTTSGPETVESDIYVFTIPLMSGESEAGTGGGTSGSGVNFYLQFLEQIIDADTYNQMFSGELENYSPTGVVTLNGVQQLTQDQLSALAAQVLAGQVTIQSITIE